MASQPQSQEDPLVAALPPATDYMTYLTLLEYQLTPQNLPTLSRLLSDDDGKLAEEIGWDLLRLLLPLLKDTPREANRCLEIVARRGNPREMIVRVAEELEKLGDEFDELGPEDDDNDDLGSVNEKNELPTFPGEARRIHLGQMTLEGMPEAKAPAEEPPVESDETVRAENQPASIKSQKLQALFNMLGILHPRIKTQYPSRFLATSLPAALGAYRQIPISTATTSSFLAVLEKLAGKQRPSLPPRSSTQGLGISTPKPPSSSATTTAPLPDPEAKAEEEETGVKAPSEEENSIILRLLDAVILEVLDEYMSSLAPENHPCMSWTARLRERLEPERVFPGVSTETKLWQETQELKERDTLLDRFFKLSKAMNLDTAAEIKRLVHKDGPEDPYQETEQEPSEYPTSPSQIPFPSAGVIFLHAYESYLNKTDSSTLLSLTELTKLIAHSFPLSATPSIPSPALQDSLLSLLYKQTLPPPSQALSQPSPAKFLLLLSTLTQLFVITPYPTLRSAAHSISTQLLHSYSEPTVRMRVITQTLQGSTLSTNWAEIEEEPDAEPPGIDEETGLTRSTSALQPHPIPLAPPQQLGQLKAVGVDWLKDEFAGWIREKYRSTGKEGTAVSSVYGLDPAILTAVDPEGLPDAEKDNETPALLDLLFPRDLPVLSPSAAAATASFSAEADPTPDSESGSDTLTAFLLSISYFISTLNLLCIVMPHLPSPTSPGTGTRSGFATRISKHVASLNGASKFLLSLLQHATTSESTSTSAPESDNNDDGAFLADSRADIFALEDACARATATLKRSGISS